MSFIDQAVREAINQKRQAWATYLAGLHAAEEPSEEQVTQLVEAVKIIGSLSWAEVRADESALADRQKLEAQIAEAEKKFADAHAEATTSQARVDAMIENQQAGHPKDMGTDFTTPSDKHRSAVEAKKSAAYIIDKCDTKLRKLRVDFPRAFGLSPDVSL
jgi:hypothetical protein